MIRIFFSAPGWAEYQPFLPAALKAAGIEAEIVTEAPEPASIDYILYAPSSLLQDFAPFTRAKAVMSLWAGVERIVGNQSLTQPLTRMVDHGLTESMVEYVTGHVLRHHLGMDRHILNPGHIWDPTCPPLARQRPVTFLGNGELGLACARALQALNFPVKTWGRSEKSIEGIASHHGPEGLAPALAGAQIVVTLLPNTPQTHDILSAQTLALTAPGAVIINPGRGPLIDDQALLAALDSGQISHATLDVFRIEPLPQDHPFWAHPRVTITPHIAADTRAMTASDVVAENIRRSEAGLPLLHLVDRNRGY
ncbi:glyoxylate/hydroxypyruvate reductase A [Xinfangfangia sp. D13-10-4-6]|uniref:2-hydroxyacid dehydrogenase n=1 Tax=Pseudogemmobacter hezensis TaxID=2737662 RepID=UPI001553535E|nr:glyoxylate/hydroxypyruvate reductase A [Pseudogemmobacter hezensis]NPD15577.1 glyoxylate/hydroxypyruvate reductase A [Pseudogemmobacter hezensis]